MNILLFGISNVGKSVTGEFLAARLNYEFYDLDEEVKKKLKITLEEFVHSETLLKRDQIRCSIIHSLISLPTNKVIAITPLSYIDSIQHLFLEKNIVAIELIDSAENIFDRLVFSDENDNLYKDDEYKNLHKDYYLNAIQEDIEWYGSIYSVIKRRFDMDGRNPDHVTEALIEKYHLKDTN